MPLLLIVVGLVLIICAVRNTLGALAGHLQQDINGQFFAWVGAIVLIGAVGYVPQLQNLSRAFLALIAAVVILKSGSGLVDQFRAQLNAPAAADTKQPIAPGLPNPTIIIQGGSGGGGAGSAIGGAIGQAAGAAIGGAI